MGGGSDVTRYLEDGLGAFLVVRLGLLHDRDEGQLLQVLQDGEGGPLLGQLLAVAFALGAELADGDAGQEAFHVRGAALLQHLRTGWKRGVIIFGNEANKAKGTNKR